MERSNTRNEGARPKLEKQLKNSGLKERLESRIWFSFHFHVLDTEIRNHIVKGFHLRIHQALILGIIFLESFRAALPHASIYVYDNRSTDATAEEARLGGAIVGYERWPGKGNVVRRMFSDVEADIYVIADGDGTYDAGIVPSQYVRRIVTSELGMPDRWHWREYIGLEELQRTFATLSPWRHSHAALP